VRRILEFARAGKISRATFGVALLVSVVASGGVGWRAGWQAPPPGWHGKVAKIARGGGGAELRGTKALGEGALVESGASLATDRRQRARLDMADGSVLVLDRDTEIELDPKPASRGVLVHRGVVVAEIARGAAPARFFTSLGEVDVSDGAALTVTATDVGTDVEVTRGAAHAKAASGRELDVEAGQEALLSSGGVEVGPAAGAGGDTSGLLGERPRDASDESTGGVGELRARRPGQSDENDRPLRVASHTVKVRIAGAMARTEVEETFANDTNDDLEGIYRFPVPAGALVDRLALEQDGKLEEGAFVEKARAEKILRGAIANATPVRRFHEDIVWVPGPWRDPALLEWKEGGRFELRIFPIPKHTTRRVVIGYTQTVDAALGLRRYVYPLPSAGGVRIDDFSIDAQVLGADPAVPVRARGYDVSQDGARFTFHEAGFSPRGDLTLEYATPNRASELSSWAFDAGDGGRFAAISLRPHLPASVEARPRDWVVAVDDGRAMFGERFERAARVAVELARTLDRRDRVTVLACDVGCRRASGGFLPAGATAAKAAADFLGPIVPDGASDLASAVRSAGALGEAGRELRVVLVSDGVASAGYVRPSRLADEVRDATPKGAAVFAVPVGSDADADTLSEIARGGGGVVVPYAPGERTSDVARALAGAGAGELLRDVTVELPPGLESAAPREVPTLRAGGETYVLAKMNDAHVRGDVVVRGTAGGAPFEKRFPVDLTTTTDAGTAFVPRLFARARIRDLERDGTDAAKSEAVALSEKLAVPSRFTSLLVLESDAMFRAFGIDRNAGAPRWTGETVSSESDVATTSTPDAAAEVEASASGLLGGAGSGGGGRAEPEAHAASKAARPAEITTNGDLAPPVQSQSAPLDDRLRRGGWRFRRPGRFMRRVFHREATIAATAAFVDSVERVSAARRALDAAPDDRAKHRDLARALLRRGADDELARELSDWQKRDPLDGDVIALRAELLAARGDRSEAVRVLTGVAASADPSRLDQLALGAERAGEDDRACALRVSAAERTPDDATRVARAVRCERARGRATSADRWLAESGPRRSAVDAALATLGRGEGAPFGDIVVDASWTGGADLDLAIVDPSGQRLGWLAGRGRVDDPTSRSHEKLGVSSGATGTFLVEVVRSDGSFTPSSGVVTITAFGMTKRVPFVLGGASARVARVDARWVSELVPIDDVPLVSRAPFEPVAARAALVAIPVSQCTRPEDPLGAGHADVVFSPETGRPTSVMVSAPFTMTRTGACVRSALFRASVAPFSGGPRTVTRNFVIAP